MHMIIDSSLESIAVTSPPGSPPSPLLEITRTVARRSIDITYAHRNNTAHKHAVILLSASLILTEPNKERELE